MNLLSVTCNDLTAVLRTDWGKGGFHAAAVYRHVMKHGRDDISAAPGLTPDFALKLQEAYSLSAPAIEDMIEHEGVTKIVFRLADGLPVESVHIPMPRRATLCISCQAGCRMGCAFCSTGDRGLQRNLLPEEIVGQVYAVRHGLGRVVDNVVFMGMGEPLDNLDNVAQAIRVLSDQRGLDIAHSRITVSTAGLPDGIQRLGDFGWRRLNLAVSLNAANDSLRSKIMPINRTHPLATLKKVLLNYPLRKGGVFFIEYVLLRGVNDGPEHARDLGRYLEGLPARVNVIGYNTGSEKIFKTPPADDVKRFCGWVAQEGLFVRMRASRGKGACAACGQLGGPSQNHKNSRR